jgi:hypothetical protein
LAALLVFARKALVALNVVSLCCRVKLVRLSAFRLLLHPKKANGDG